MRFSPQFQLISISILCVVSLSAFSSTYALTCYVCNDCEIYFNETHITECEKTETKCIKMVEVKGIVSRDCGIKETCTRQVAEAKPPPRTSSTISKPRPEKLSSIGPRSRFVRQLLPSPPKKVDTGPPPPEINSLHCCEENECNGAGSLFPPNTLFRLLVPLLTFMLSYLSFRRNS